MRQKIALWMRGRYGTDALSRGMLVCYLLINAVLLFVGNTVARILLQILATVLLVMIFFRMFSRNIPVRTAENNAYLKGRRRIRESILLQRNRWRYRRTHVYRKCPHCGVQIKLPRVEGNHQCACPRCGESFSVSVK